jgi:hypothetical protein
VELDVIAELPLKKKLKKQKANKRCLELNAERAAFLAAFNGEPGFRRFLADLLDGITDDQARKHPLSVHSIIELVAHMSATMDLVSHRLAG